MSTLADFTIRTLEGNQKLLNQNLQDLTPADAERPAGPGGNNVHWIVGHIAYWRSAMSGMLGGNAVWQNGNGEEFKGLMLGDAPSTLHLSYAEVIAAAEAGLANLVARIREIEDNPEHAATLGNISQLSVHETYHVGQLGILRRMVGKPGVVGMKG